MTNNIDPNGVIAIKQEGFFYSVSDNDALIFTKYLGYKLFGVHKLKTGFPVAGQDAALNKINKLHINYDLVDKNGNIIVSQRFDDNAYEIINPDEYPLTENSEATPAVKSAKTPKPAFEETMSTYINVLRGLNEGVNALTGEIIPPLSDDLKECCLKMAKYFEGKLKAKERMTEAYPNIGKKWSADEDELLLKEYADGKTVKELADLHKRSLGSIRSRLLKLGASV